MLTRTLILLLIFYGPLFSQEDLNFEPESGVHKGLKKVGITIPKGGKLYYTMDGQKATVKSSQLSSKTLILKGNTVLRFLYVNPQGKKREFSKTYITDKEHNLPVFSIITHASNIFDEKEGIYSMGCCADTVEPYLGANFWKDWEKEVQIAYINERNEQVVDQKAGIQMFGGFSLGMPQKSFGLYARKKYGDNRFKHNFFENRPFDEYKNLVLRNAGSDMQGAHIRDAFASTLIGSTGLLLQAYRPVAVYINGVYWGKYNLREKINEHFIEQHFGYDTDSLVIMRHEKRAQYGSTKEYITFWNKLQQLDLSKKEDLDYVDSQIDIDNYLLYNTCEIYTGNADAGGNIRYYKHLSDTAKWRWIFYDVDHSMNIFLENAHFKNSVKHFTTENKREWPHPNWSTLLIRKLLENDSIRNRYIQQFCDQLNTTFKYDRAMAILDSLKNDVAKESVYHQERWGVSSNIYKVSFDKLYEHIEKRPNILFRQLRERFNLKQLAPIKIVNTEGGNVKINSINTSGLFEGLYFKDIPIQIEAKPKFDYVFIGWKELTNKGRSIVMNLTDSITLTPVFKKRKQSIFRNKLIINEIDAKQDSTSDTDYIEILNTGKEVIDINGWIISDGKHNFEISESIRIEPGSYFVFTEKEDLFKKTYSTQNCEGGLTFGISKKGEIVTIYDKDSLLVDRVSTLNWQKEEKGKNWSRVSLDCEHEFFNSWVQEKPTPGIRNWFCAELKKNKEERKNRGFWLIAVGIGLSLFGFGLILVKLKRSK